MIFAQLTCSRSLRQLVEIHEGGHGPIRLSHVGTLAEVCDVLIVMCVSVAEFGGCTEDSRDSEDSEVDAFIYERDSINEANASVYWRHCCSMSQTRYTPTIII